MSAPDFDTLLNIGKALNDACYAVATGSFDCNVYSKHGISVRQTPFVITRFSRGTPNGHLNPVYDASGSVRRYYYDTYNSTLEVEIVTERTSNNVSHSQYVAAARKVYQNKDNVNQHLPYHRVLDVVPSGYTMVSDEESNRDISTVGFNYVTSINPSAWITGSWTPISDGTTTTTTTTTEAPYYQALFTAISESSPSLEYSPLRELLASNYSNNDPVTLATEWTNGVYNLDEFVDAPTFVESANAGMPAFRFDGNDALQKNGFFFANPNLIIIVFKADFVGGFQTVLTRAIDGDWNSFYISDDEYYISAKEEVGSSAAISGGTRDENTHILELMYAGASSSIKVDGVEVASGTIPEAGLDGFTLGTNAIGSTNFLVGDVQHVLVYDTLPDTTKRDAVISEMAALYSVSIA